MPKQKDHPFTICDAGKHTKCIKNAFNNTSRVFHVPGKFYRSLTLKASQITVSTDSFASVGLAHGVKTDMHSATVSYAELYFTSTPL